MSRLLVVPVLIATAFACESAPPVTPEPPAPVKPVAPPAPTVDLALTGFDGDACAASVGASGAHVADYTATLPGGSELVLHLFEAEGDAQPAVGDMMVGWGELKMKDVEKLVDIDVPGTVHGNGSLCVASVQVDGTVKQGQVVAGRMDALVLNMTLLGALPAEAGQKTVAAFKNHEDAAWVPWPDKRPDGAAYVSIRLGEQGNIDNPTVLAGHHRLQGDAIVALSDGVGQAVYTNTRVQ